MAEEQAKQRFELHKIYVKDMSFESPMAPNIFRTENATPSIDVQLNVRNSDLGNNMYESIVIVTVNGKLGEKDAFLIEVQQAGVFEIAGLDEDKAMAAALEVACPNVLFPFAREVVNDLVSKGGFPQLLLSPVNFESVYRRKLKRQAEQAQQSTESNSDEATDATSGKQSDNEAS